MPSPFLGLAALAVLYIFCLIISFLVSLVYSKRGNTEPEDEPAEQPDRQPEEKVYYFERVRSRRRKKPNKTIAIRGKLLDDEKTTTAE